MTALEQRFGLEGLGHVAVRPVGQRGDDVVVLGLAVMTMIGTVLKNGMLAQAAQQLEPDDVGQHDVHRDDVHRRLAGELGDDLVALAAPRVSKPASSSVRAMTSVLLSSPSTMSTLYFSPEWGAMRLAERLSMLT